MAARRDKRLGNGRNDRRTTFGIAAPPPADTRTEVMSVSARAHAEPADDEQGPAAPVNGKEIFLTPRVLDERAFQQFTDQLRSLIQDAESASRQLEEAAGQNSADRDDAARSSQQLQERLRLSARMLKAIQVQSEALDRSTGNAQQIEQRLQQLNEQVERRLAELDQRTDSLLDEAMRRIDGHTDSAVLRLTETAEQAERLLQDVDRRMEELMPRAERLCQLVETAEVNIAALAHRSADNARKAQQVGQAVAERAEQCRHQLAGVDQRFDRLEELNRILSRAEVLHQRWSATLEQLERSAAAPPPTSAMSGHSEVKSSPASIQQIVAELRRSVGEDMARLSSVVQDIAIRVDRLQSQRSGPSASASPPTHISSIETSRQPDQHSSA